MSRFLTIVLVWLCAAVPVKAGGLVKLHVGTQQVVAEVAATPAERMRGLMMRTRLPANRGMLFVFPETGFYSMWMKDTPLPLAAAFLDEAGVIVDIAEMQPYSLTEHAPRSPVKYVLEMRQYWFSRNGVAIGERVEGVRRAGAGR